MNLETAEKEISKWDKDFLIIGYRERNGMNYLQTIVATEEDLLPTLKLFINFRIMRLVEHDTAFYKKKLNEADIATREKEIELMNTLMAKYLNDEEEVITLKQGV